jgi:hypothetical protein
MEPGAKDVEAKQFRERPIEQLRAVLSMLCHFIWTRQTRPGEYMWSIPVDKDRDFDCILSDAIDELEYRRSVSRPGGAAPGEWQPMDTAPEATYVLAWLPNYGAFRAIGSRATQAPAVMEWWAPQADGGNGAIVYPSHWMPLPPGPTPERDEERK